MKVIVTSPKGGTGKSSITTGMSVELARNGHDLMLLDADIQASSKKFVDRRLNLQPALPQINCTQISGGFFQSIRDLGGRYEHLIVDTGSSYDSPDLRKAMVYADCILVPVRPALYDLETLDLVADQVNNARAVNENLRAIVVLSLASPHALNTEIKDAREYLEQYPEIQVCPTVVYERRAYRSAAIAGIGAGETDNPTARAEIQLVTQLVFNL